MNTEKISPKHTHPFAINQQKTNEGGDSRAAGRAGLAGFGGRRPVCGSRGGHLQGWVVVLSQKTAARQSQKADNQSAF